MKSRLATVDRIITETLPSELACSKEVRETLMECCLGKERLGFSSSLSFIFTTEFIHLLASEANDVCEKENRKTIGAEHILSALQVRHEARQVKVQLSNFHRV